MTNDFHTRCNMVSSIVNLCTRCTMFWTKTFDISSWFITYNSIPLCWLHKGVVSLYGERTPGVIIPHWKMTPTRHAIASECIFSQCEISPVGFITCNAISLCWLQKEGQTILWWINFCCSFLMLYKGSHTLTWRVILLHNERTTARSSYLTLKIDSYTTWNMCVWDSSNNVR